MINFGELPFQADDLEELEQLNINFVFYLLILCVDVLSNASFLIVTFLILL